MFGPFGRSNLLHQEATGIFNTRTFFSFLFVLIQKETSERNRDVPKKNQEQTMYNAFVQQL